MHEKAVHAILCGRKLRVVKIIRVNRYAVGPSGKARRSFESGPNDNGLSAIRTKTVKIATADGTGLGARTSEGKTQAIKDRLFPEFNDLPRDIFVPGFDHELPHVVRQPRNLWEIIPRR